MKGHALSIKEKTRRGDVVIAVCTDLNWILWIRFRNKYGSSITPDNWRVSEKVECRVGKEFGNGYNIETNKVSQISCFFSCSTSEGPACQGADESRHGSWTKRGLISTSSKVGAQLDQTMQPPPFQTKAFTISYIKQTNVRKLILFNVWTSHNCCDTKHSTDKKH